MSEGDGAGRTRWWSEWAGGVQRRLLFAPQSRAQLVDVLRAAQHRELIGRDALDMIEGVLQVAELRVRDIMIPRSQMEVVDRNLPVEQILPRVIETAHSRFPVIDGDRDRIIGILLAKDLLQYFDPERRAQFNLRDWLRPAIFIPESKRLNVLLREFRSSRNHMAIVVDEYGGVGGLVTIEDVIEQIVGEIEDEHDIEEAESMIMPRGDGVFMIKARLPIEDFNEYFGTTFDSSVSDTLAGMVIGTLGHLPRRGERLEIAPFRFEVVHADSRRVHLLKATRVETPAENAAAHD